MDFDKIKQNILNSSETSTSESESISGSELHEEFEINNFLPEFEPLKLSGKNLAQQYVSAFNTGMNVYQCLNYLQGYVYTLVTAMNETIEAWNTVVPLLEQATKEWTDEEFDYKWSILKSQVIELVTNLTFETCNNAWEKLRPTIIQLSTEPKTTVENNVSLVKANQTDYYVLTESKDKNVKKLDYYFKYDFNYLPNAPYYNNNFLVSDLDLEGYTVKSSLLTNNTFKLKNKSTGELIDYVYLMLDDNVTVTTRKDESQNARTVLAMKFLPYFAKLKTGTPSTGQCYIDACISIILEKTSS